MTRATVVLDGTFADFREKARRMALDGVAPGTVDLVQSTPHDRQVSPSPDGPDEPVPPTLRSPGQEAPATAEPPAESGARASTLTVPRAFVELAGTVALHRDPGRWNLLYRVLHRLSHGEPRLLLVETDEDVRRLRLLEAEVNPLPGVCPARPRDSSRRGA